MKKLLTLLLCCARLSLSVLAACAYRTPEGDGASIPSADKNDAAEEASDLSPSRAASSDVSRAEAGVTDGGESAPGEAVPDTPEALLLSRLGPHNFGARTFRIYAIDEGGVYARAQFDAGETIPGTVSAAVAERNACIGELFNCELETTYAEDCATYFENVCTELLAGIMEFDILAADAAMMGKLTANGMLYDLTEIENAYLSLDAPYWDQQMIAGQSLGGRLFCITGDAVLTDDEQTGVLFYNRALLAESTDEDPRALAEAGEWTLDALARLCRDAATAGKAGILCREYAAADFMTALGADTVQKDDADLAVPTDASALTQAFRGVFELLYDNAAEVEFRDNSQPLLECGSENLSAAALTRFYDGGVAFLACAFGDLDAAEASQMELGLLPLPKADADGCHRTPADVHGFTMLALPLSDAPWELSDLTVVLEAAALYNSEYVTPVYRDETLRRYGLNDEADRELLELIQSTRAADLGAVYRYEMPKAYRCAYFAAESGKNGPIESMGDVEPNPPDPIATGVDNMSVFAEMIANDLNYYIDRYDNP